MTAAILAVVMLIGIDVSVPSTAFGDGDPAADVLLYDAVYDPPDTSGATSLLAARLKATVEAMNHRGYPLRVALIPSIADLGSASNYWGDPGGYSSQYLGRELSAVFPHGNLLVVMPQGYGLYVPVPTGQIPAGDRKATAALVRPGSDVIAGALALVQQLAADNGVSLPTDLKIAVPAATRSSISVPAVIGFATGLIAIIAAWSVSLHVCPLRRRAVA